MCYIWQNTVSDTADKVAESFDDKDKADKKREKKGFKMDKTDNEKNSDKAKRKKVFKRIIKSKENIIAAASASANSGRRKRSSGKALTRLLHVIYSSIAPFVLDTCSDSSLTHNFMLFAVIYEELPLITYAHRQKLSNSKLVLNIKKCFVPKYGKFKFYYLHLTSFE